MDHELAQRESVQRLLGELAPLVRGDTVLDALAVAIAVEDSFGMVLADDDIIAERLCSPDGLAGTVFRYLGGV